MPASWTQTRVDAAWPALAAAAKAGLASSSLVALTDVTPAHDASYDDPEGGFALQLYAGQSPDRFRPFVAVVNGSRYWHISHRGDVAVDALTTSATADAVQAWAANARRLERDLALTDLAENPRKEVTLGALDPARLPGSGSGFLVLWGPNPPQVGDDLPKQLDHIVTLTDASALLTQHPSGRHGVAFRSDGGPVMQRAEDLTLDWISATDPDLVTLVLHERLRIARTTQVVAIS